MTKAIILLFTAIVFGLGGCATFSKMGSNKTKTMKPMDSSRVITTAPRDNAKPIKKAMPAAVK